MAFEKAIGGKSGPACRESPMLGIIFIAPGFIFLRLIQSKSKNSW